MKYAALFFYLTALFTIPCQAEEMGLPPRPGHEKNLFIYVKKETKGYETQGYEKPKVTLPIGHSFHIPREMRGKWEKSKWLRVTNGFTDYVPYWIETKYLTSEDRLKKVTHDWPVRFYFTDDGVSCMYYLIFKKTGEVDIIICDENAKGHVYRDGPIVRIPYVSKKFGVTLVGIEYFDEKTKKLHGITGPGQYLAQGLFADPKKPVKDPFGMCVLDCDQPVAAKFRHKPHASWMSSRLYGNDSESAKLKRVVVSKKNEKYDVFIESQYGMKCSVYFDEKGRPALLQNCYYSGDGPQSVIDSERISLRCNIYGNEEVCNGEYKWHDRHYSGKSRLTIARRVK